MLKRELKKIRKYAKLRNIDRDSIEQAYEEACRELKKVYNEEMDLYFEAIKDKDIQKGQSILHVYGAAPKRDN